MLTEDEKTIEDIRLSKTKGNCDNCGAIIYPEEPYGFNFNKNFCFNCAKEILRDTKDNNAYLLKKLKKLYNKNMKTILVNRLEK